MKKQTHVHNFLHGVTAGAYEFRIIEKVVHVASFGAIVQSTNRLHHRESYSKKLGEGMVSSAILHF